MSDYPNYGFRDGPVIMIGFGSIGRETLPLILRHFDVKPEQIIVVAPVEDDEVDFARCLQLQKPYPGPVEGHFTTCTPLTGRSPSLPQDIDPDDPWQFRNVLVH
jgi:homospermidine synthase